MYISPNINIEKVDVLFSFIRTFISVFLLFAELIALQFFEIFGRSPSPG